MSTRFVITVILLLVFMTFRAHAQFSAGGNDTINPGVPVTLTASFGEIGIPVILSDDEVEGPLPIGFDFSFFGDIYNEFYIGANGWISFIPNASSAGIREVFAVPSAAIYNPKASILSPFVDLLPKTSEPYVYYLTTGEVPNRRLVVMWCQTPLYWCQSINATFQIVLHEGTNIIENQLFRKPECLEMNKATMGVQNSTGLIGFAIPGRNATYWSAEREGYQYLPVSVDSFDIVSVPFRLFPMVPGNKVSFSWYEENSFISSDQSITVAPHQTTTYTANMILCDGETFDTTVTVVVFPRIPDAFSPNNDGINDLFRIIGIPPENITRYNFQVYNRWGQLVFTSTDILESWDGKMNGVDCPEGLYAWVIYYEDNKKIKVSNKGSVILIR